MAQFEVTLPSLGEDAGDTATVSFTYFNPGDAIDEGADLIEMVTDKATFNVPSPKKGRLVKYLVTEDTTVTVGDKIAILEV